MALIAVASAKGAPGVSTTALALAAVWPRRSLLVEADEHGGDLVFRQHGEGGQPLDPKIGMLSLALAGRRGLTAATVGEHTQTLHGGLDVLLGLASGEQASAWTGLWPLLGRALATIGDTDVIADLGRIGPKSASLDLLSQASLVLLVSGTTPEELAAVRDRAAALGQRLGAAGVSGPPVAVLLVSSHRELAGARDGLISLLQAGRIGADVLGGITKDPKGALQLAGRKGGRVERSELLRSARLVVSNIGSRYGLGTGQAEQSPVRAARPATMPAVQEVR
ncbi:hypothetical protein LN042_23245 [Kitasatospora sp. RB6PN24]|uniref:hypothetical protein n=1 Tax=Kitasatospora humi TaxID=2893891 RepID=UPI001E4DA767|nr:hypothetical protein [Kitasatospora humi]MCC9309953.1 hypothetical protein [Kitasatospora humi]